jgi:hypothetical protein
MFFQKKNVKIIATVLVIVITATMVMPATADVPYIAYDYDWWGETYPVQSGYVVDRIITSNELDTRISGPQDMFVYTDEFGVVSIFIVDTGNNRILITDRNFNNVRILDEFTYSSEYQVENFLGTRDSDGNVTDEGYEAYWAEIDKIGTTTTLNDPRGIHVTNFQGETRVYIADHENERVLATDMDGNIWMEYRRPPVSDTYPEEQSFRPSKVLTDNAGNVYICIRTITDGAVVFSETGFFLGYYGANRVTRTSDAMLNYFLRLMPFVSREMMERRTRPVPVEFSNFTIDEEDQFIYTTTETNNPDVNIVKKINPAGQCIFEEQGLADRTWGDGAAPFVYNQTFRSQIVDISIDNRKDIFLLDRTSGKVFQYDEETHLMFIFGGKGEQKGLFTNPVAVETHNNRVYVLDSTKNSITIFKLTEFGGLVVEAMDLFSSGLYTESLEPWEEVLRRDSNYYMAYIGMGNAKLSIGEFREALDYFYFHSWGGYGRAFKDFRINYIRDNFNVLLVLMFGSVALLIGGNVAFKIYKKKRLNKEG